MPSILDFKRPAQPFSIKNKSATRAEILLYGAIGESYWEDSISAKTFSEELKKLDASVNEITVRINSPGGDVFDGIAIYNRLKQHSAKIIVRIDGLAASIASIIALAGDEVIMGEGALYMVHLPWTMAYGNRNELDNTINRLLDVEEQLISIYAKKCKKSRSEIKGMLEKETWMDSAQAMDNGFVDSTSEETMPIAASILDKASWINKMPKNIKTSDQAAKNEIKQVRQKIEDYLARK